MAFLLIREITVRVQWNNLPSAFSNQFAYRLASNFSSHRLISYGSLLKEGKKVVGMVKKNMGDEKIMGVGHFEPSRGGLGVVGVNFIKVSILYGSNNNFQ